MVIKARLSLTAGIFAFMVVNVAAEELVRDSGVAEIGRPTADNETSLARLLKYLHRKSECAAHSAAVYRTRRGQQCGIRITESGIDLPFFSFFAKLHTVAASRFTGSPGKAVTHDSLEVRKRDRFAEHAHSLGQAAAILDFGRVERGDHDDLEITVIVRRL